MNIGSILSRQARYRPNHVALVFDEERLSYQAFNARVNRLANGLLAGGIAKGDKIATILPNCLELLEIYWAVAKIGAVVVPLSPLLRGQGLTTLLNDSDTVLLVSNGAFVEILDAIKAALPAMAADRYFLTDESTATGYRGYQELMASSAAEPAVGHIDADDVYNIIYSSGTTGLPKGIVHTHFIRAMYGMSFATSFRVLPESVVLHTGSLVYNGAFLTMLMSFFVGATYVVHRQFTPDAFINAVAQEGVTHTMLVPAQIVAILHDPAFSAAALESLEMLCTVGAPLHETHKVAINERLPGRFYELYGCTEGFGTILDKHDYMAKPGSVGSPAPYYEMRILNEQGADLPAHEVGEIVGRSPIMMPGYYKQPELTAATLVDGWLHTGDLGYVDEAGFLYLVDRKKDMIISGGVNVYPKDIEEIVVQHPSVREAAVFGIPSAQWGETPLAAVILTQANGVTAAELRAWVNQRVAARYQRLHDVVILDEFPRSVIGKTLKRVLREPYWAEQGKRI